MQKNAIAIRPPGKSEHLLDDVSAAMSTRFYDVEESFPLGGIHVTAQNGSSHHDWDQNVVEIVGDAAGESADTLEPLRAEELFLDLFLLGHVGGNDELGFWFTMLIADEGPPAADDNEHALFRKVTAFTRPGASLEQVRSASILSGSS